jgi:peptidoglycan-associated lipoprotein
MSKSTVALTLVAVMSLVACGGKKLPPPPAPVAPVAPPPAPPQRDTAPVEDEYSRIKNMSIDDINRLGLLADVHFDFDKFDVRESDRPILAKNAETLKKYDFLRVTVEGHCDERGTVEYNLALGTNRAKAAFDYTVSLGVATDRLKSESYGKEAPICRESTEDCWARNRRAHFVVTGKAAR